MADQQYEKGRELEQQGYWERALAAYRRACGLDTTSVLYLVARGRLCHTHGVEEEAVACYEAALRLRPNDTVALYNQAQLFAARGQLDEARANLTRIVAEDGAAGAGEAPRGGAAEMLGERAAPIYCKLGDIALRREEYRVAEVHFRRALAVAPESRYATAALGALERLAEFKRPIAADGKLDPKVAVYAYAGAMALGMPGDDGITLPLLPGLGFDSLDEVAATLVRFVRLATALEWRFDAVAALDAESQPLAIALARALGARSYAPAAVQLPPRGTACLAVMATGADPQRVGEQIERLAARAGRVLTYAVGLREPVWDYAPAPHVVSVPVRLEFPWNWGEASAAEHAEAFGEELGTLLTAGLAGRDDGTTAAQLEWYGRHARLAFEWRGGVGGCGATTSSVALASAPG